MWYADSVGLKKVYERVREFEREHGALWTPAPLLKQLAEQGKRFSEFTAAGISRPARGGTL
jgi:3-hydroxyacyl-CoA dehydrogenase